MKREILLATTALLCAGCVGPTEINSDLLNCDHGPYKSTAILTLSDQQLISVSGHNVESTGNGAFIYNPHDDLRKTHYLPGDHLRFNTSRVDIVISGQNTNGLTRLTVDQTCNNYRATSTPTMTPAVSPTPTPFSRNR